MRQPLQRCMIVASTLDRFAPGTLDARALEGCAWLIAQRVALLNPGEASQLPDRGALRSIVETLTALGHAEARGGHLHATASLGLVTRHAALTLPPEVRLAISHATQRPVEVSPIREATALGAAFLAGLAVDTWADAEEIRALWSPGERYEPIGTFDRDRWQDAVSRASGWHADLSALDF